VHGATDDHLLAGRGIDYHHDRRRVARELPGLSYLSEREPCTHGDAVRSSGLEALTVQPRAVAAIEVPDVPTVTQPAQHRVLARGEALRQAQSTLRSTPDQRLGLEESHYRRREACNLTHLRAKYIKGAAR
jgi:hypothetical protein